MTKSYKNWLMLTTNPTTRIISPQCLMIQDHNESLVQHEEEKVHFPPKLFHPITQSHPELSAALGELQFCTEICSFSTLYCVIDVRTIIWRDDRCAVLLKEKATHSKWDEIYFSAFQRAGAQ